MEGRFSIRLSVTFSLAGHLFPTVHGWSPEQESHVSIGHLPLVVCSICVIVREEHLYPAADDTVALVCGPPSLIERAAVPGLKKLGFVEGKNLFGW